MKILVIEDDLEIAAMLSKILAHHGYSVLTVSTKADIDNIFQSNVVFNGVILDRLIENFDTKDLIKDFRKKWPNASIIVLSAISTADERVALLNMGADDYLGKPFSTSELVARIQAINRRQSKDDNAFLQVGNTVIDPIKRVVIVEGRQLMLPSKEFLLLKALCEYPGKVWNKFDLLDNVWGLYLKGETNVVETTILNVRKKLADLKSDIAIKNSRNTGYWVEN